VMRCGGARSAEFDDGWQGGGSFCIRFWRHLADPHLLRALALGEPCFAGVAALASPTEVDRTVGRKRLIILRDRSVSIMNGLQLLEDAPWKYPAAHSMYSILMNVLP